VTTDPHSMFIISKARQESLLGAARMSDRPSLVGRRDSHGLRMPRAAGDDEAPRPRHRSDRRAA